MSHLQQITNPILNAVKSYPFHACMQPNSFTVIDTHEMLSTTNFGATMEMYRKGYFWGRAFEGNGANENELKAQYPAIYLKKGNAYDSVNGKDCISFEIGIVDQYDCDNCGDDCRRTRTEVDLDLYSVLKQIKTELLKMAAYDVFDGLDTKTIWATPSEIIYLELQNPTFVYSKDDLIGKFEKRLTFVSKPQSMSVGERKETAVYMHFTYCDCFVEQIVHNYINQPFDKAAVVKCSTCI